METHVEFESSNTYPDSLEGKVEVQEKIYHEEVEVIEAKKNNLSLIQ